MIRFLLRVLLAAAGLWLAARYVPGISVNDTMTLVWAALLLGVVDAIVRPIVFFLTLPVTVITFGLFLLVINAAMLGLVAALLKGFAVHGFVPALLGSIVISLVSWLGAMILHVGDRKSA